MSASARFFGFTHWHRDRDFTLVPTHSHPAVDRMVLVSGAREGTDEGPDPVLLEPGTCAYRLRTMPSA